MVWREEKYHITDFYFYMINLKGIICKKHHVQYTDVPSAIRPILHGPELPVPESDGNIEYSSGSKHNDMTVLVGDDAYKPKEDDKPVPLTQAELSDLTWDLNLWKESVQLQGSCLNEKHLLEPGTIIYWFWDREKIKTVFHVPG